MKTVLSRLWTMALGLGILTVAVPTATADMECCTKAKDAGLTCVMCDPAAKAEVGKPAVDFMLKDAGGKTHSLSDEKDKVRVLVWTNPQCPFVVRHYKAETYQKLRAQFPEDKVSIWLVDSSNFVTSEEITKAAAEFSMPLTVLADADGRVGHAYEAKTTPHVFVIDPKGVLVYNGAIDSDPAGKESAEAVKHYAADAVQAVLDGKPVETATTKPYGCSVKYAEKKEPKADKAAQGPASAEYQLAGGDCCKGKKDCDKSGDKKEGEKKEGDKASFSSRVLELACGGSGDKGKDGDKKDGDKTSFSIDGLTLAGGDCCKGRKDCDKDKKEGEKKEEGKSEKQMMAA